MWSSSVSDEAAEGPSHGNLRAYFAAGRQPADPFTARIDLAVGMFDGVHRGHQRVIAGAKERARAHRRHGGVLTFDPHPSRVVHPESATQLLYPLPRRLELLLGLGVDFVLVQKFTSSYARRTADSFAAHLRRCLPGLASLHVGENFRFGAGRKGDVRLLQETAAAFGIEVHALPRQLTDREPISSSRIRKLVEEGEMEEARHLLGRPYTLRGKVVPGRRLGREMGFPTLNIPYAPETRPRFGVYFAGLLAPDGKTVLPGIVNYGRKPTVEKDSAPLLEVHLLAVPGEGPPGQGNDLCVFLLDFLRPEKAFDGVEALREQITRDVATAHRLAREGRHLQATETMT